MIKVSGVARNDLPFWCRGRSIRRELVKSYRCIVHDDVIKWKLYPCYWPFGRGIHQSPVDSPHKGQWRGDLMFSLICAWTNGWADSRGDLIRHRAHYDIIVMRFVSSGHQQLWYCMCEKDSITYGASVNERKWNIFLYFLKIIQHVKGWKNKGYWLNCTVGV